MIRIDISDREIVRNLLGAIAHIENGAAEAVSRAINKTLREVRKEAIKLAQTTYTARAEDLARKTALDLAKRSRLFGVMSIEDKRGMNLVNFQARPNRPGQRPKEGASVKVLRTGGRKTPRKYGQKAFIATGRSGNTLMFVRKRPGSGGLEALYGPHPIQALSRDGSMRQLEETVERSLGKTLQSEIDTILLRAGRK